MNLLYLSQCDTNLKTEISYPRPNVRLEGDGPFEGSGDQAHLRQLVIVRPTK
jgi:hypothetical protein